jgi:type IV pilus assembly protein PilB
MVLSTLHTNDAPSTINRMLNMGIEPFLVSSAVNCVVAQRLARRICSECVQDDPEVVKAALLDAGMSEAEANACQPRKGAGCANCAETGFKGRVAVYEVMVLKETLRDFILNGATAAEIKKQAIREGMKTLRRSCLDKLGEGITTLSEVHRVSTADK